MGFLKDLVLGSGPSTKSYYTDPNKVNEHFNSYLSQIMQQLTGIGERALGGAASFGPGFQGTSGILAQRAVAPYLMSLFGQAAQTATPTIVQTPGNAGLLNSGLSAFLGGAGIGLGGSLFGGDKSGVSPLNLGGTTPLLNTTSTGFDIGGFDLGQHSINPYPDMRK